MEDNLDYSKGTLEQYPYRTLQQLAKSLNLPSNVKKVYLIEMINAKKCSSVAEVERIVKRVKMQRRHLSQAKKRSRRTYIAPDTSSSESGSPPISLTPKRPTLMLKCSELRSQLMQSQSLLRTTATKSVPSDRVLRSCNVKTIRRPYLNTYLQPARTETELADQATQMSSVRVLNKYKPKVLAQSPATYSRRERQMVPVSQVPARTETELVDQATQMSSVRVLNKYKPKVLAQSPATYSRRERQMVPVSQVPARTETELVDQATQMSSVRVLNKYKPKVLAQSPATYSRRERQMVPVSQVPARTETELVDQATQMSSVRVLNKYKPKVLAQSPATYSRRERQMVPVSQVPARTETELVDQATQMSSVRVLNKYKPKVLAQSPATYSRRERQMVPVSQVPARTETELVDQATQMSSVRVLNKYKPKVLAQSPATYSRRERQMVPVSQVPARTETELAEQATMSSVRVLNKYRPKVLAQGCRERRVVPASQVGSSQLVVKRQRLLSGVYPIGKQLVQVGGVGVRDREGNIATLNAFVHKPRDSGAEMPRPGALTDTTANSGVTDTPYPSPYPSLTSSSSSVYYHKKIRAEQLRERRVSVNNNNNNNNKCPLPRINEAFGQFRRARDYSQPLYVQVGDEADRILNYPSQARHNTCLLETIYNFKSHFLTRAPLLKVTAADTRCVYSAPTVATAVPQRPTLACTEPYMASYERDSQYCYGNTDSSRMNDCLRFADEDYFRCHEEQNTSGSSIGTVQSQELGANVTISDMVEDALELISQDGDYMERMGMDVRMQCVLCNWAGPKIILEYHIRKEHSTEIDVQEKREWNITYTLGSIVNQQLWQSRVMEHERALYVLSVKCEPAGCFMGTLSHLSPDPELTTGSITMFNKVTGKPYSWCGQIQELPPSLPYDSQPGLKLDLANLDLLPNSANLKFRNGELVLQSPTKVVFGPLELNDIHIILFVKISD